MVRHVAPAEIIGAANAAPAAPVSTPMYMTKHLKSFRHFLSKNSIKLNRLLQSPRTVVPTKSDSDIILCLQKPSKTLTVYTSLPDRINTQVIYRF